MGHQLFCRSATKKLNLHLITSVRQFNVLANRKVKCLDSYSHKVQVN